MFIPNLLGFADIAIHGSPWFEGYAATAVGGGTVHPTMIADFASQLYAAGAYDGVISGKSLSDIVTLTRATTATYNTNLGSVLTAAIDAARFPRNPLTGENLGLQIEDAEQAEWSYSSDLSNATWTSLGTKSANMGVLSPDGVNNAGGLTHTGSTGDRLARAFTFPTSTRVTTFAFIKPLDNLTPRFAFQYNNGTAFAGASGLTYFDVASMTVTPTANVDGGMYDFGNGWYYIWASATTSVTSAATDVRFYVNALGSTAGDRTAFWGSGTYNAAYPSSYIPTTTTTALKEADFATSADVSSLNPSIGAMVVDFIAPYWRSGTRTVFRVDDGTDANVIAIEVNGVTREAVYRVVTGSVEQANIALGVVDEGSPNRIAINYGDNAFAGAVNGGVEITDVSGTVPAFTTIRYGHGISTNWLDGTIRTAFVYGDALGTGELSRLSTVPVPQVPLVAVTTENRINNATETRAATNQMVRFRVTMGTDASELAINNANRWLNTTSDGTTGNAVTIVKMAIEKDGTTLHTPVTYAGSRSRVLANGEFDINSDPVYPSAFGLTQFSRGEVYWVRAEFSVPSAASFMPYCGRTNDPSGNVFGWYNPANTTVTNGVDGYGAVTATGTALDQAPAGMGAMVLGRPLDRSTVVPIGIGDSINFGVGDTTSFQPNNGYGIMQRAMTDGDDVTDPIPCINLNRGGALTGAFNTDWVRAYFKYANVLVDELGTNDIGVSGTGVSATIQSNLTVIYNHFKAIQFGGRIIRTYLLPRAASTDSWATLANQTINTGWAAGEKSNDMNDWADARLADGTINAVVGRSSLNSASEPYKWDVNGTPNWKTYDGTHTGQFSTLIRAAELRTVLVAL